MAICPQQTKTDKSLHILHTALKERGKMSISDMQSLLGCNRQSAYNYIKRLIKDRDCNLQKEVLGNKVYYSLATEQTESAEYIPLTPNILRKYNIIRFLQQHPCNKYQLWGKMSEDNDDIDDLSLIDIGRSTYYKLIEQLETEGEILQKDGIYFPTGQSIPLILQINDTGDLYNMWDELYNIFPGHPFYTQLHSIEQKIQFILGNIDGEESACENYITYGRKYLEFSHIDSQLRKLEGYDYKNRILEIEYIPDEIPLSLLFSTGLIVYCLEKDTVYLLGQNTNTDTSDEEFLPQTIININTISNIRETEMPNFCYMSETFQEIFETMFSISIEPPVDVKVEFDMTEELKRELRHLEVQRRYAKLQILEETIIYEDKIRGLSDFINYLRQFGGQILYAEPAAIREKLCFSSKSALQRYREETDCQYR